MVCQGTGNSQDEVKVGTPLICPRNSRRAGWRSWLLARSSGEVWTTPRPRRTLPTRAERGETATDITEGAAGTPFRAAMLGMGRLDPPAPPSSHGPHAGSVLQPVREGGGGRGRAAGRGLSLTQDSISWPSSNERAAWGLRTGTSSSSSRKRVVFVSCGTCAEPGFRGPLGLGKPRGAEGGRASDSARLSSSLTTTH